jgi:hypothetical protein
MLAGLRRDDGTETTGACVCVCVCVQSPLTSCPRCTDNAFSAAAMGCAAIGVWWFVAHVDFARPTCV